MKVSLKNENVWNWISNCQICYQALCSQTTFNQDAENIIKKFGYFLNKTRLIFKNLKSHKALFSLNDATCRSCFPPHIK